METPKNMKMLLQTTHGLSANRSQRNNLEHQYYEFHKRNSGAKLRAKYRPEQDR